MSAFSSPTEGSTYVDGLPAVWSGVSTGLLAVGQPHLSPEVEERLTAKEELRQLVQRYTEVTSRRTHSGPSSTDLDSSSKNLSNSWPGTQKSTAPQSQKVNLRGLSQSTLKLLGSTVEKFASSSDLYQGGSANMEQDSDLVLNEIAERLNAAAAKNKSRSRSRSRESSVERDGSTSREGK